MMKKVPKRRFKGFLNAGDWEQRKLGDVVKRESVTQVSSTEYPAIEYEDVIPETGQLNKDIYKKGVQKVGILFDANKVLYGKLRPYLHNWVAPMYTGVAVGDWWVLNPCGLDRGFLYTLIQTVKFDTIANQSAGSKMPRADWKLLSTTEFSIPSLDEQIKIGKLVEGLNDYITLHQRKLEKLQATKKALLYELFPIENSRRPKRRFKGFTGDWEQRKLGELVTVFSGQDYKHLSEGDIPVYGTGGYMLSVNEALSNDQDAIGIGRKGTIDKPYILKAPFWTVDTLFYAIPKEKMDLNFIFCIFKNVDWRKLDESTGVPSLSKSTITNVDVYCPFFEEQLLIGRFFLWIDSSITLHQRKLEKFKNLKAAYLNEMFV